MGELALDLGQSETWVKQALGHAFDSKVTRKYMRVREGSMMGVFEKIAVYQFNEYGPCSGQGNKGGPTLHRGGVSVAC